MTLLPFVAVPLTYNPVITTPVIPTAITILFLLLIYSVWIELMLFAPKDGRSYQRGTYSLSRHPGWLWFSAMHILLGIRYLHGEVILLMVMCILWNLVVISIEDRWIFPRLFSDYGEYAQRVRFLL